MKMFDEQIEFGGLETVVIKDKISRCEDLEELKQSVLPMIRAQKDAWSQKVNDIIIETGLTKTRFGQLCGVSRQMVDKWCKGAIPRSREQFLAIGMVAGYSLEKMNQLLQRYGRYPGLYSKSLEDCVCMFVINHSYGEESIEKYKYILGKIKEKIIREDNANDVANVTTEKFDANLLEIQDEEGLEQFITDHIAMFSYAYHKFYAYVKMTITANYMEPAFAGSIYEMAKFQQWSSSLKQCVSAIMNNKWYPTRNKIISLGLHLSMDHEQIDEMLELAHMEPLCAKNIFESVIMFILDDASLNNMLDIDSADYDPDELCMYAGEVLRQLDLPEIADFLSELPEVDDDREKW